MTEFDRTFPPLLAELHELDFDTDEGGEIDFEPYQEFQSAEDNASWFAAWTGDAKLTGSEYRVFGQDGTGGYAAFWLVRPGKDVLEQPVVFFGSEGELGVIAKNFNAYLWLLAGGFGPFEAVEYGEDDRDPKDELTKFAQKHAKSSKQKPSQILADAKKEFPDFEKDIRALCK